MAAPIRIKRTNVPGRVPTTGDLALGELGLNTYDGKLFTRKDNGTATIVEIGGGTGGTATLGPIAESKQVIAENYTLSSGYSGMSVGPVEVAAGYSVTVPAGATWMVLD